MSDQMRVPDTSLPPGPGPDRPFEELEDYFVAHLPRYTPEALARTASLAGHDDIVIEDAIGRATRRLASERDVAEVEGLKSVARQITPIGFLFLAAPIALMTGNTYGLQAPVIVGQLVLTLLALALARWSVNRWRGVSTSRVTAIAGMLAVPIVIFLAFPGICIYYIYTSLLR
jgi:hypothetical protein